MDALKIIENHYGLVILLMSPLIYWISNKLTMWVIIKALKPKKTIVIRHIRDGEVINTFEVKVDLNDFNKGFNRGQK